MRVGWESDVTGAIAEAAVRRVGTKNICHIAR